MKQEFECHDEYELRLKLHGPKDFEDARYIKELFIKCVQNVAASLNVHEMTHFLHELHDIDRWMPMCALYFKEECYRREREPLKLDLEFLQSYKIDPEYLRELFSRMP